MLTRSAKNMTLFGKSSLNIETEINTFLTHLSKKLFRHSKNHCVSFRFTKLAGGAGRSLEDILAESLSDPIVIGGSSTISVKDFYEDITNKISYQGDEGSHPNLGYIQSESFTEDLSSLLSTLQNIVEKSEFILSFWLREGHPFYPVFWDFSYLIESKRDSYLFFASCSD